jgi:hypothetical protein
MVSTGIYKAGAQTKQEINTMQPQLKQLTAADKVLGCF